MILASGGKKIIWVTKTSMNEHNVIVRLYILLVGIRKTITLTQFENELAPYL